MRRLLNWLTPRKPASSVPAVPPPTPPARPRGRPLAVWVIGGAAGLVLLLSLAAFFLAPLLIKHYLVQGLSQALHRPVSVGEIRVNPWKLTASLRGFRIDEPQGGGEFLSFDELLLTLEGSSLLKFEPVAREVRLMHPRLHVLRRRDGSYNFSDLITAFSKPAPASRKSGPPPAFALANVQLLRGEVLFDDQPLGQHHQLTDLNIVLPYLSTLPRQLDEFVQPRLSGRFDGTAFAVAVRTKPFNRSLDTTLELTLERLDLARLMPYSPVKLNFGLPSAWLSAHLSASFRQAGTNELLVSGRAALQQVRLRAPDGAPLVDLEELTVHLKSFDVFKSRAEVAAVTLRGPEINLTRDAHGKINLLGLLPTPTEPGLAPPPEPAAKPSFNLNLALLQITAGRIHFQDALLGRGFRTEVSEINASLRHFTFPQLAAADLSLDLRTSQGVVLSHQGSLLLSPLSASGHLEFQGVRVPDYALYLPSNLPVDIASGTLRLATDYRFEQRAPLPQFTLSGLEATLEDLRLRKRGAEEFLRVPSLAVRGVDLDLAGQSVEAQEVISRGASLRIRREGDGSVDLAALAARPPSPASGRGGSPAAPTKPWHWKVGTLALDKYSVAFEDRAAPPGVQLALGPLNLKLQGLSSAPGGRSRLVLDTGINGEGRLKMSGSLGLAPLGAEMDLDLKGLQILPFHPYFARSINILVRAGEIAAHGHASVALPAGSPPRVAFRGEAQVNQLATVDKASEEDFLKWKSLYLGGIDVATAPMSVRVGEIALGDFYSRISVFPDGHLNLQNILAPPGQSGGTEEPASTRARSAATPTAPSAAATASAMPPIRIDRITLQGGNVGFTDHFIKPNYTANLTDIGGSVTGLSSQLDTTGEVALHGRLDSTAALAIVGRINPLSGNLFLDLKAQVDDIELGPFTPYSGKYVGYAIEKGKMTFKVAYHIQDHKLEAQNQVILNQLTFGDRVESPTALKLPVLLAVALLKDRNGVIDVNLPISGSLNDPKFSIGGIVWRVVINLLEKAITAPFALLGSAFGGGGTELSYIDFDAGRATLGPAALERTAKLRRALVDRPALKLEITPHVHRDRDREGLRQARFDALVRAQKVKALRKDGAPVANPENVLVSPEEYPQFLQQAYREAKFPKPRNLIGLTKRLPVPEMEKLLQTSVEVSEDDLIALANRRAQVAKEAMLREGGVGAERVFLVRPKLDDAKPDGKASLSRVDFSLK